MSTSKPIRLAGGNTVQTLQEASQTHPAMLKAIRGAATSIRFANYCVDPGTTFDRFSRALTEAAGRGVCVQILLDAYGSHLCERKQVVALRDAGVEVVWRRQRTPSQLPHYNHGLHKKLLIIDNKIGFTGGVGVADFWLQATPGYPAAWRDTHFALTGPVVTALAAAFDQSWQDGGGQPLSSSDQGTVFSGNRTITPINSAALGWPKLAPAGEALLKLIAATKRELTITTAYFGPSRPVIRALQAAARRGVHIRILTNGPFGTHHSAIEAGRHRYGPLLAAGVHIYEYQPTKIHAKVVTSDGATAIIGSANLNFRSLYHDEEFSLLIRSPQLANQLDEQFERDLNHTAEINPATWSRRPLADRLRQTGASLARYIF